MGISKVTHLVLVLTIYSMKILKRPSNTNAIGSLSYKIKL